MHSKILHLVSSSSFQNFIMWIIVINGITLGLETSKDIMSSFGSYLHIFDKLVISIFVIEIVLRIYAHRFSFFKDPWSIFDFVIVAISLVPAGAGFEILRVLRVLRLFRLITIVPQMRKIVAALLSVIPGMASIAALMTLFFYVFSIMATQLYSETFPDWFGTLGASFYTLFQIMTLESWSMGIVRPIMEQHPYAWLFFIPFIFVVTFVMINLIVAIVVDAMAEMNKQESEHIDSEFETTRSYTKSEIDGLKDEIKELKELIAKKL